MTVTEAMQFGTPVIASTAGALPEAGGDAAEYAGPDDVAAWVELIERHLTDVEHHRRGGPGPRPPTAHVGRLRRRGARRHGRRVRSPHAGSAPWVTTPNPRPARVTLS